MGLGDSVDGQGDLIYIGLGKSVEELGNSEWGFRQLDGWMRT